ncbi:hypothetical protein JTB14_018261, partial [Gonioctena quinquepunctata]
DSEELKSSSEAFEGAPRILWLYVGKCKPWSTPEGIKTYLEETWTIITLGIYKTTLMLNHSVYNCSEKIDTIFSNFIGIIDYALALFCPVNSKTIHQKNSSSKEWVYKEIIEMGRRLKNFCPLAKGCDFVGKGSELRTHQINCKYSTTLCPLRFNNCRWRGIMTKMVGHCREKHPDNIFFKNKQKLMVSNFIEPMNRNYYIIFKVFNTLFRCTWDLSRVTGGMRFAVYHIGSPRIHEQYSFEFSIFSRIKNADVITLKGPCFQMERDNERFMGKKYLSANHSFIKEFCDEDGDLEYSVTVLKNNADQ